MEYISTISFLFLTDKPSLRNTRCEFGCILPVCSDTIILVQRNGSPREENVIRQMEEYKTVARCAENMIGGVLERAGAGHVLEAFVFQSLLQYQLIQVVQF